MSEFEHDLPAVSTGPSTPGPTLTPEQEAQQPYVKPVEASMRKIMLTRNEDFSKPMPFTLTDRGDKIIDDSGSKPINWRLTTEVTDNDGKPHKLDMFISSSSRYRNMGHDVLASFKLYPIDYERSFDIDLIVNRNGVREFRDENRSARPDILDDLLSFLGQVESGETKVINKEEAA